MNPHRDDTALDWTPSWEWLGAVLLVHVLIVVPWLALLGPSALLAGGASLAYYGWILSRHEVWRFALIEDRVVLFEPHQSGEVPRPAKLRGSAWITERWVVVRTSRRVLTLYAGCYDAVRFARLRRALLGGRSDVGTG